MTRLSFYLQYASQQKQKPRAPAGGMNTPPSSGGGYSSTGGGYSQSPAGRTPGSTRNTPASRPGRVKCYNHSNTVDCITITLLCNILQFFTAVKNNNFQMKKKDNFLIFAQNIDCG